MKRKALSFVALLLVCVLLGGWSSPQHRELYLEMNRARAAVSSERIYTQGTVRYLSDTTQHLRRITIRQEHIYPENGSRLSWGHAETEDDGVSMAYDFYTRDGYLYANFPQAGQKFKVANGNCCNQLNLMFDQSAIKDSGVERLADGGRKLTVLFDLTKLEGDRTLRAFTDSRLRDMALFGASMTLREFEYTFWIGADGLPYAYREDERGFIDLPDGSRADYRGYMLYQCYDYGGVKSISFPADLDTYPLRTGG